MKTQAASEPLYGIDRPFARTPVSERLAEAGFLLLFPGFLAYHYGVSAGWWGGVLGGLFGGGAVLAALASLRVLLERGAMRRQRSMLRMLVFGTIAYMSIWSLVSWLGIRHDWVATQIMVEAAGTVIIWIAMLFIGARLPCDARALRRLSAIGIALTLLSFGHAFYTGGFPSGPFLAFFHIEESGHATYQGIGRSLLAIGLVAALATRPRSMMSIVILMGVSILTLTLGSRAHFFVLILSLALHLGVLTVMHRTRAVAIAGVLTSGMVVSVAGASLFLETRASEILDLASSASWQLRHEATAHALQIIAEHPFSGQFGYHVWDNIGYAHNALSAWTQYGLIGFIAFGATMICSLSIAIAGFIATRGREPAWHLALHFNLIGIVLAIASEAVMSSVFPALAWGFTLRAQHAHRAARAAFRG